MLNHLGTQVLDTERLVLRPAELSDRDAMYGNWASDPEVTKYLTWPTHTSPEVTQRVLSFWVKAYEDPRCYQWMIVPKTLEEPIGTISVVSVDEAKSTAELGYCIGSSWWHQGYTTEAVKAVMEYLMNTVGFRTIEAKHDTRNPYSGAVMRKCGMHFVETACASARNNQGICDLDCYLLSNNQSVVGC